MPLITPRTGGALGNRRLGPTDDRKLIRAEVESGLRNSRDDIADAMENGDFYRYESQRWLPMREAETEFDFAGRPKRQSGFLRQAVDKLCQVAYNPGPQRSLTTSPEADELLQAVYKRNHIDAVMQRAEVLSTLDGVAALQAEATNDPNRPVRVKVWGRDAFTAFLDPEDPTRPYAVVTIDRYDQRTRYRLWYADVIETYLTERYTTERTAGGIVATFDHSEPNTYGVVPFSFFHYELPIDYFWTVGPGRFLRRCEARINDKASLIDELGNKYAKPIGIFKNVSPTFNPQVGPGRFIRLVRPEGVYGGDPQTNPGDPSAEYLQAQLQIDALWGDIREYRKLIAEAVDLPPSSIELDYADAPSGISLVIRMAPLMARCGRRRPVYQYAETELARVVLTVAGAHYERPELTTAAEDLDLLISWPEPRIPVPGPDRDQQDEWEMSQGLKSRVQVCMERYGLNRDQAIQRLQDVADDNAEADAITGPAEPGAGQEGGQGGEPIVTDEEDENSVSEE